MNKQTGDKWPRKRTRLIFIAWRRPASSRRPKRLWWRCLATLLFFSLLRLFPLPTLFVLDRLWCNMHNVKVLRLPTKPIRLPAGAPILTPIKGNRGSRPSQQRFPMECWPFRALGNLYRSYKTVTVVVAVAVFFFSTWLPHGNRSPGRVQSPCIIMR